MLVGWIHKERGTGSRMHTHKNEQFNYVVRWTLVGSEAVRQKQEGGRVALVLPDE